MRLQLLHRRPGIHLPAGTDQGIGQTGQTHLAQQGKECFVLFSRFQRLLDPRLQMAEFRQTLHRDGAGESLGEKLFLGHDFSGGYSCEQQDRNPVSIHLLGLRTSTYDLQNLLAQRNHAL